VKSKGGKVGQKATDMESATWKSGKRMKGKAQVRLERKADLSARSPDLFPRNASIIPPCRLFLSSLLLFPALSQKSLLSTTENSAKTQGCSSSSRTSGSPARAVCIAQVPGNYLHGCFLVWLNPLSVILKERNLRSRCYSASLTPKDTEG
jgi:hypothetical protein